MKVARHGPHQSRGWLEHLQPFYGNMDVAFLLLTKIISHQTEAHLK